MFRTFWCRLKHNWKYRALPSQSILVALLLTMCLAPKPWKHSSPAPSCGDGQNCGLGEISSATRKHENVSDLLSDLVWTDDDLEMDRQLVDLIGSLSLSNESRVISFGLYGNDPKYTQGAVRNAELAPVYFPGWIPRFYLDSTVPPEVVAQLKDLKAEIVVQAEQEAATGGAIRGMFWRFLVADDPAVDRYIVRDSDSRLNARDRFAVEEWIESKKNIHSIRDHIHHCNPMNGGMWGGTKEAIKDISGRIREWSNKDTYFDDMRFLDKIVWENAESDHIAHDAYCCEQFPHTRSFPTKRYSNYQHVGQRFDGQDNPRMSDIDGLVRDVATPQECRRNPNWVFG